MNRKRAISEIFEFLRKKKVYQVGAEELLTFIENELKMLPPYSDKMRETTVPTKELSGHQWEK